MTADSKMPERIWVDDHYFATKDKIHQWDVEYIRADLAHPTTPALVATYCGCEPRFTTHSFVTGRITCNYCAADLGSIATPALSKDAVLAIFRSYPDLAREVAASYATPAPTDNVALVDAVTRFNAAAGGGMEIDRFGSYVRFSDFEAAMRSRAAAPTPAPVEAGLFEEAFQLVYDGYRRAATDFENDESHARFMSLKLRQAFRVMQRLRAQSAPVGGEVKG